MTGNKTGIRDRAAIRFLLQVPCYTIMIIAVINDPVYFPIQIALSSTSSAGMVKVL